MCARLRPPHLLLFHHALANNFIDGQLGERCGDGLPVAVAFAIVGDEGSIDVNVAVELPDCFDQFGEFVTRALAIIDRFAIHLNVIEHLQRLEDIAVPQI